MMSWSGSFTPGLSAAIRGSFHFVILPRKMSARVAPSNLSFVAAQHGEVVGHDDRAEHGRDVEHIALDGRDLLSVIGPSVAPKSTVPSVNCRMPPPEPMDW